ncbi:hypothetical protein KSP40_PGU001413 [Platanthera guangdongensis]|uniref:Bifunctional inhibitor/plant lipid transfer protein/seed storage helical domain-containing protein n=1 Tax=Platanthera guangdongensis TaxID=2320717 RepID=A0ABR2MRU7_9ASPA
MRMTSLLALFVAVSAALLLSGTPSSAVETTCNPMKLKACAPSLILWRPPSVECCVALHEQKLCFCKYLSDPELRPIIRSEQSRKMAEKCGVRIPDYCIIDHTTRGKNIAV